MQRGVADSSRLFRSVVIVTTLLALLGTLLIGWQVRNSIRELTRQSLRSTLSASVTALEFWLKERREDAQQVCSHSEIQALSVGVLSRKDETTTPNSSNDLESTAILEDTDSDMVSLREAMQIAMPPGKYVGWVLVGPDGRVFASSHDPFLGSKLPIAAKSFHRIESGSSTVCRPFASPVVNGETESLASEGKALMLAMAPVQHGVNSIGALGLILDPTDEFSRILTSAQSGYSDETYAFDREATMISQSRFEHQLRSAGLLPTDVDVTSPLNIKLIDPGVDLTEGNELPVDWDRRPLTWMADRATRGATGENIAGYNDYRGVPVVGAWQWLPTYDFGVTTEMDVAEAYDPVRILKNSFLGLIALIGLCVASLLALASMARRWTGSESNDATVRRLGQYELGDLVGEGGMGRVYRGKHSLLRRDVAVKVLEGSDVNLKSLSRFEREVQLTSSLQHPNTIDIYDYGRDDDGTFFYVMEYVDGISMFELVQEYGRQPPNRVVNLLVQVCHSLAEAHARGMVHRDVKPANLLVTARAGILDLVKVLDFGLVKELNRESLQLTQSDAITGSPRFMSPEAIKDASSADSQSDLYSVGAVGYFLLTGSSVFDGDSSADVAAKQLNEEPLRPEVLIGEPLPDDLQNVLMSCLRKDPRDRPHTARDLVDALMQCEIADEWSDADASDWWQQFFHARHDSPVAGGPRDGSSSFVDNTESASDRTYGDQAPGDDPTSRENLR